MTLFVFALLRVSLGLIFIIYSLFRMFLLTSVRAAEFRVEGIVPTIRTLFIIYSTNIIRLSPSLSITTPKQKSHF